jgi:histidyl-tRNA synthetase
MLGGPPVAGVGWAAGIERLAMLAGNVPVDMPRVAVMSAEEDADSTAFALAEALRTAGIAVDLPTGGNIGKRMKKADRAGIRYAVILGGAELASGTVQLRDLGEGAQEEVAQADLVARLLQNPGNEDAS